MPDSDAQTKINKLWDGASAEYDATPSHGFVNAQIEAAWKDALRVLLPPPPARVLDAGAGTGVIALALADLGYDVLGVDLSEGMLRRARSKAGSTHDKVTFERGDAIEPPGDPDSFDAVFNRHVLWTLTDPPRALANWLRLVRPGGRLVIVDGIWGRSPDDRLGDTAASLPLLAPGVTLATISDLVTRAGFVDLATSDLRKVDRLEREASTDEVHESHYVITASKRP